MIRDWPNDCALGNGRPGSCRTDLQPSLSRLVRWLDRWLWAHYNCSMTEVFQCRVDRKLVAKARAVAREIGLTPGEVVRLMFTQMVKRRAIPFPLQASSP